MGNCRPILSPFDVVLDEKNVVQPDILVVCDNGKLDGKRCNGSPDLVIEVTSSNNSQDYVEKLALYKVSGVREYWIVDPVYERVLVYFFEKSNSPYIYTFDTSVPVGIYNSDLRINIRELLK